MKYLSAKEIAEKWGLSLRSVQYFCSNGRIPGAQNLGKQWIIPADAVRPSDSRFKTSPSNDVAYIFPLFIYSPAYTYSDSLNPYEYALFSAQLKFLECDYSESIRLCRDILTKETPFHVIIGVYYTIALCAIPLGNYYEYKKSINMMEAIITPDDLHYEDYKLLMFSVKRYIGWNHKLFDNIDATKLSSNALYLYQYECLLSVAMTEKSVSKDALHIYDALALHIAAEGIEPLEAHLRFALAALHVPSSGLSAENHIAIACNIATSHNWMNIISRNLPFNKSLVKKSLDKNTPGYSKIVFEIADREFNNWRIVNRQESGVSPFPDFNPSYVSAMFMLSQGMSNNEICTVMGMSSKELQNTLDDCYKIANVKTRNELKKYMLSQMSTWFES